MKEMSFADFKKTLLACIYKELDNTGFDRNIELSKLVERIGLSFRRGWLRKATETFESSGWAKVYWTLGGGADGGMHVSLTGSGIEQAEQYYEEGWEQFEKSSSDAVLAASLETLVPASDRIVTLSDNANAKTLRRTLDELTPQIEANNEIGEEDVIEFERRFSEFRAGNLLLKSATASAGVLATVLMAALRWLLQKLAETALAPLLISAIAALAALLGLPWP
jgi:hypothetical protein